MSASAKCNTFVAPPRRARGIALVVVLSVVVLLTVLVSFALTVSNQDRAEAGKQVKNTVMLEATESALQYAKAFFYYRYLYWNTYLALDYTGLPDTLPVGYGDMLVPNMPTGYRCAIFARDDADELATAANPLRDNNNRIYAGAVCKGPSGKISELLSPLEYNQAGQSYTAQNASGTQGLNNTTRVAAAKLTP